MRRGSTICLTILLITIGCARADALRIVASGITLDWNPVNTRTYPALLVSRWISEALYERQCIAQLAKDEWAVTTTVARCQRQDEPIQANGSVRVTLNPAACQGLRVEDVRFTLEQIAAAPYNEYNQYQLKLPGPVLFMGQASGTAEAARARFDFPVFRQAGPNAQELASMVVREGGEAFLNQHSAGSFQVDAIAPEGIALTARATNATLDHIDIRSLPREQQLAEILRRADAAEVVLAMPADYPLSGVPFAPEYSPDLDSFAYIGFNFAHPAFKAASPPQQKDLLSDQDFRALFTEGLWSIDVIQRKVGLSGDAQNAPGIFMGMSFDTRGDPFLDINPATLRSRIAGYLARHQLPRKLEFTLLISPRMYRLFTEDELESLLVALQSLWQPATDEGLHFNVVKRASPKEFDADLQRGEFHLLFDDFIYGRSDQQKIAFVDPDNRTFNRLGIALYTPADIQFWRDGGEAGIQAFRERVAATWPVAVVGFFPQRDLFSNRIERAPVDCGDANPMPFAGLPEWRVRTQ